MEPERDAARRVGTTVCNKWTLERLIGVGGMAAVYEARHKIGRRDAIKILHPDIARDRELAARFEQEAHAVNHFRHAGAVEIRDIDVTADGAPFLVMELLDGEPLASLAKRDAVQPAALLKTMDAVLDVLAAAHIQGIVHRDVKPDNIFILRDGSVKVLDFGIARVHASAGSRLKTKAGSTLGTLPYMPPEQVQGEEIDPRADVFAVGATMFRILAKRRVHEAPTEALLLIKMATEPAPPLLSVSPAVSADIAAVVDRALMFARDDRYPDAHTMQADIRAIREGRTPPFAGPRAAKATAPTAAMPRALAPDAAPSTRVPPSTEPITKPATPVGAVEPPRTVPLSAMPTAHGWDAASNEPTMTRAPDARRQAGAPPPTAGAYGPAEPARLSMYSQLVGRRLSIAGVELPLVALFGAALTALFIGGAVVTYVTARDEPATTDAAAPTATHAPTTPAPTDSVAAPDDPGASEIGGPKSSASPAHGSPSLGGPSHGGPSLNAPSRGHKSH